MRPTLLLCLAACTAAPVPGQRPPPLWQINPDNARGVGASIAVEDLNHDGLTDLVFGAPSEYGALVYGTQLWLGVGFGAFAFHEAVIGPVNPTQAGTAVAVLDLDGDGWSEIAVGEPEGPDCGLGTAPTCPADARRGRVAVYSYDRNGLDRTPVAELLGAQPGDQLGLRVVCPGDVDHDGYDDLVVTAPRALGDGGGEGLALLYRGGPGGVSDTPAWSAGQTGPWSAEGESLAVADMNHDGWLDVLVGAPEWDGTWSDEGRVLLYLNGPGGLSVEHDREWAGGVAYARFGASIAAGGDVDGDGHPELLVGAPLHDHPHVLEVGEARLFRGSASGPDESPMWIWRGGLRNEGVGLMVAMLDQDDDGYSEVLVGAAASLPTAPQSRLTSFPGGPEGPDTSRPLWYRGTSPHARVAWQVVDAGDLDGDGLPEMISGLVGAVSGRPSGLAVLPGRPPGWDGDGDGVGERDDCDDGDPARGARAVEVIRDGIDGDCDGRELCPVDLDDDGHAGPILMSADLDCLDYPEESTAPIDDCADREPDRYPGAATVPSDGRLQSCDLTERCFVDADGDGFPAGTATVASADGDCDDPGEAPPGRRVVTVRTGGLHLGRYQSAAGDVDGDGGTELMLPSDSTSISRSGPMVLGEGVDLSIPQTWLSTDAIAGGDLDGDGYADLVWWGGIHRTRAPSQRPNTMTVFRGGPGGPDAAPWIALDDWIAPDDWYGLSLFVAADMDGDGDDELVIGHGYDYADATGTASVHILTGDPAGIDRAVGWALPLVTSAGEAPSFGSGDLDGDGWGDLVVGAYVRNLSFGESDQQIWMFRGTPNGPQLIPGWPVDQFQRRSRTPLFGVDDFNADGYDDVAVAWDCGSNSTCLDVYEGGAGGPAPVSDLHLTLGALSLPPILTAITAPGDVDGDGFGDLVIAAWDLGAEQVNVVFGSARGLLSRTARDSLEPLDAWLLHPAGEGELGARVWAVGDGSRGNQVSQLDVRWLVPDCDDRRAGKNAAAWDAPGDGVDADCDGYDTCWFDGDGDCMRDPSGRVTPDASGRCDGPRELPAGAPVDVDDTVAGPMVAAGRLAVWAGRRCVEGP